MYLHDVKNEVFWHTKLTLILFLKTKIAPMVRMVRIARLNAAVTVTMETRVEKQTDTARKAVALVLQTTNVTQVKRDVFSHFYANLCVYLCK
jgi:hypothetical protein